MGEVAYQNKDIMSKVLSQGMREKSLDVYGIKIPKVKDVKPVNLPAVEVSELSTDDLFILEDESLAIIDYESQFTEKSKIKYVNHIGRILKKYGTKVKLRMIVLYTCSAENVNTRLDVGCMQLQIEAGYLQNIETAKIQEIIREKIRQKENLNDQEIMQMIILPLTVKKKEHQREILREVVEQAKKIQNESQQMFVIAGALTFADKIIEPEYAKEIKEWICMNKVAKLFEEEKWEAVKRVEEEKQKAINRAEEQRKKEERKVTALRFILKGKSLEEAKEASGLSLEELEELQK